MPEPQKSPRRTNHSGTLWRTAAIIGPPALVLATGLLMYLGLLRSRVAAELVDHTNEIVSTTSAVLKHLTDAETGQRGYVLTGERRYLEPYTNAKSVAVDDVTRLRVLTADNPVQRSRADSLRTLTVSKLQELERTIALRESEGFEAARRVTLLDSGRTVMDSARVLIERIDGDETRLLAVRQAELMSRDRTTLLIGIVGLALSILFALLMSGQLSRALTSSEAAEAELGGANEALSEQAMELEMANEALQSQAAELQTQTEELQTQTAELQAQTEKLVAQTDQLERARREADARRREATKANEAKSQFLANMSHELRTPLNAIGGHVQLLEMELHGPITDAQRTALSRVDLAQRHLLGLINDILNLTRITSGKLAYDITNVDLGEVVSDAESMIVPQLEAAQLTYEKLLQTDDCVVRADADKLRQIVINLLGNAIKFTEPGGHVSIEVKGVEGDEGSVALAIRDTGIGIPESDLQTIFDPFVQVDARLSSTREGAGLGLAISRDLARGMGGDLWAESVVGEGSVLTVMLNKGEPAE